MLVLVTVWWWSCLWQQISAQSLKKCKLKFSLNLSRQRAWKAQRPLRFGYQHFIETMCKAATIIPSCSSNISAVQTEDGQVMIGLYVSGKGTYHSVWSKISLCLKTLNSPAAERRIKNLQNTSYSRLDGWNLFFFSFLCLDGLQYLFSGSARFSDCFLFYFVFPHKALEMCLLTELMNK